MLNRKTQLPTIKNSTDAVNFAAFIQAVGEVLKEHGLELAYDRLEASGEPEREPTIIDTDAAERFLLTHFQGYLNRFDAMPYQLTTQWAQAYADN